MILDPVEEEASNSFALGADTAQASLEDVQLLLNRYRLIETTAHLIDADQPPGDDIGPNPALLEVKRELAQYLDTLHSADIAYILEAIAPQGRQILWDLIRTAKIDGEVLLEVSDAVRQSLIRSMDQAELVAAVGTLQADEVADIAPELPSVVLDIIRQGLPQEERERLRAAMSYPESTVGALMDFSMISVREDVSLEQVVQSLRQLERLPDITDQIFVTDADDLLLGALPIHRLLVGDLQCPVQEAMQTDILRLSPSELATETARAFVRYDLISAAVLDAEGRLIGRVTVDRIMDHIQSVQETTLLSQAGLRDEEDIFAPVLSSVKNRAPWLLLNLLTATVAAYVASRFESTVSHVVMLAFLMSIVAGLAGNSGNQTMTLIIRAIALGQITQDNMRRLLYKELGATLLIGLGGGVLAGLFAGIISSNYVLGWVMMAAIVLNMLVGTIMGMAVPLFRHQIGQDPAVGSSVLLTFATDTMGFFIFLGLAHRFLM